MQSFQQNLSMIGAQFKALSASSRLLIGSLMVILVMSLFLVSQYAGKQTLAPLGLNASLDPDARQQALAYLEQRGISYKEQGADVLVPVEQKYSVLAELAERQLISGEQINFESLMADDNPFMDRHSKNKRYLIAKMNVLASMISQMSGIERATVVIDQPESSGLGKSHVASSASVTVLTRGSELNQNQVDAISQLVARSHAGLKPENVAISDARAGRILFCRSNDAMSANKYLDVKTAAEQHAVRTLETALNYIPGVRIAVNAQVDTTTVVQRKSTVDDPKVGPTSESSQTMSSSTASPAAEPAVRPNTGASLAASGRAGTSSSTEKSESTTVPVFGQTESQIQDGRGYPLQINATVGVPRSYFVRILQQESGADANAAPDAAALEALIASETEKIKAYVTPLIDTQAIDGAKAGMVIVSVFQDFGVAATLVSNSIEGSVVGGGGGGGLGGGTLSEGLVKYVSLGSLAVIALAMMFMMVRKATVRQEMPTAQELVGIPPALTAAESDLVGEADEASPALEGLEINEDSLRRQQMLDQITDMVENTPDEAAGLLRRWIRSEG